MTRRERELRRRLRGVRAPGEAAAGERARRAVMHAHSAAPVPPRAPRARLVAAGVAAVAVVAVLGAGLTAPGQAVAEWLRDIVRTEPAAPPARPVARLPAAGRVLVAGENGVGLVADRRAPTRVGAYLDATWSPNGRFAAVTTRRALLAVTPGGEVRWRVEPAAPPRHPRWSPDGFRLAYLAGPQLRVLVGDGTDDRLFRGHVKDVAPAFRPTEGRTVAWVDADGHVRVADVDRAQLEWRSPRPAPRGAHSLSWSADGERVLVAGPSRIDVIGLRTNRTRTEDTAGRITAATFAPRGRAAAYVRRTNGRSALRLIGRRASLIETSGRYRGLVWSPDGRWLLTEWDDRWVLVKRDGRQTSIGQDRGRPLAWTR